MSFNVSPIAEPIDNDSVPNSASNVTPVISSDIKTNVFMGTKPALKNWKMFGAPPKADAEDEILNEAAPEEVIIPRNFSDRAIRTARPATPYWLQIGQALAVFITVAWITYAAIYILALPNSIKTITSSPLTLGGVLASVLAPVAMLWLCLATWQRRSDAHIYAQALRQELRGLFFPNADQSNLIGDDIRELMKQATEMSASSRGAIKAIQRARTGLRAEIRDFAGVSQKAEFHIDRLADALSKRAEELLSLTETIESQTENISVNAQRGVGMWENVSAEMTELGEELDTMFNRGADKLQTVSDATVERVKTMEITLSGAVETLSGRISGVATQIEDTRSNLDEQSDKLMSVADSIKGGATRLETSLTDAEHIYGAVEGMMNVMSESLTKVESTAENFYEKTDSIEKKLESRADALKESADKLLSSTDGLHEIGDLATHKLGEALSLALSGAETITSAVRRSKDMMDRAVIDASTQIEQTSKVADEKLEALMAEARANRDQLAKIIAEIEEKQQQLATASEKIETRRIELSDVVAKATTSLDVATLRMAEQSDKPLKLIQSSIDQMQEQTQDTESKLAARTVEVQQETGKLKSLVADIDQAVQASVSQLEDATTMVSDQSRTLQERVAEQRKDLESFMDSMDDRTIDIAAKLTARRSEIERSITSTEEKINALGVSFFDRGDALVDKVSSVSSMVTGYEESLSQSIGSVNDKYNEIADKVGGQIEYMTKLTEFISPEADRILSQVQALNDKYDDLRQKCTSVSEDATNTLIGLSEKLEARIASLGHETAETSRSFINTSNDLTSTLAAMKQVAEGTQDKMDQIGASMKGRADDLHLITDRVERKVEMMQNNLGTYAKDLSEVIQLTMSDLELATEKFGETTSALDGKSNGVTARIVEATRHYTEEGHRMSLLGEQTVHKAARIVAIIKQESDKLVDSSKSSLLELQKSGDTLAIRSKELEEYLKASVGHTRNYGDELRNQVSMVANYSSEVVDNISAAAMKLSIKATEVKQTGLNIIDDIHNAGTRLEEGTNGLGRVARMTIEAVDNAVTGFSEHGKTLSNTVHGLTTQIKNVKDVQAKTERETFLSSAKFVIESLYSLAVDVSRHLEGDLDVRVLRTYQKGDVSAYVRHLVDMAPRMPIDKSQRKFIEDSEFRTYVLRFIRQYEELLEQAQANDYGDLLSNIFSTSDIGKLYKILCEISGRNSRDH